ncbi:MAG: hypothetical protein AAFS01_00435 [Pseudomonadota bacterium]
MKSVIHRAYAALLRRKHSDPDVEAATPLVHLLDDAEPAPDMFARIEARIDAGSEQSALIRYRPVVVAFLLGLSAGALALHFGLDRQIIVARPTADAAWVPLGSVTLHGKGLRGFVRAKCHGHTHFFITMHGHSSTDSTNGQTNEVPLMARDEKILMECIF